MQLEYGVLPGQHRGTGFLGEKHVSVSWDDTRKFLDDGYYSPGPSTTYYLPSPTKVSYSLLVVPPVPRREDYVAITQAALAGPVRA
jgi:hypothetical protein